MKRRYRILDPTTFEPTDRVVELDLSNPCPVGGPLDSELGSQVAIVRSRDRGNTIRDLQRSSVDAGVFSSGEHPRSEVR